MRSWLPVGNTCGRTHQLLAVIAYLLCFHIINQHQAISLFHRCSNALNKTFIIFVLYLQPVYHHLNVVVSVTVQFHARDNFLNLTIDTDIEISLFLYILEQILIMSLPVLHQRGKNANFAAQIIPQNKIDNLFLGITYHLLARFIRESF